MSESQHVNYPHHPGYLIDCPACEAQCHCADGNAECVWSGHDTAPTATTVFVVFPTASNRNEIHGVFGTADLAMAYACHLADGENARGGSAHLTIQEWSGNLLLASYHAYGTDHPMNGKSSFLP